MKNIRKKIRISPQSSSLVYEDVKALIISQQLSLHFVPSCTSLTAYVLKHWTYFSRNLPPDCKTAVPPSSSKTQTPDP